MDEIKHQPHQLLSIFYGFFRFIMKSLASQILKLFNLGRRMNCSIPPAPPISDAMPGSKSNQMANPMSEGTSRQCEIQSGPSSSLGSLRNNGVEDDKNLIPVQAAAINVESSSPQQASMGNSEFSDAGKREEKAPEPSIAPHAKAPEKVASIRKTISINDTVEDINQIIKKRKKSKSMKKSNSLDYEEDEPKPLRSILKVGSNLDEKTDTSVYQDTRS